MSVGPQTSRVRTYLGEDVSVVTRILRKGDSSSPLLDVCPWSHCKCETKGKGCMQVIGPTRVVRTSGQANLWNVGLAASGKPDRWEANLL